MWSRAWRAVVGVDSAAGIDCCKLGLVCTFERNGRHERRPGFISLVCTFLVDRYYADHAGGRESARTFLPGLVNFLLGHMAYLHALFAAPVVAANQMPKFQVMSVDTCRHVTTRFPQTLATGTNVGQVYHCQAYDMRSCHPKRGSLCSGVWNR